MTREEIMALDMEGIETRSMEIKDEMNNEGADLETLSAEVDALEERKAVLVEEQKRAQAAVIAGAGQTIEKEEEKKMPTMKEIRSSEKYVNAYAEYIKSGDDKEVRSILTEGADAQYQVDGSAGVPVPTMVEDRIMTAWDNDAILSRVRRTNVKGILKVGFELSATAAGFHLEGAPAPTEEVLKLGIVQLTPETIKKFVTISDEAMDLRGQAFLDFVLDEIEYRIVKFAADEVVKEITLAPNVATTSSASVAYVESAGTITDFINAVSTLSDEAQNPVIIMNKQSYAFYKGLAFAAGYAVDPFDGMEVLFNNTLPSGSTASSGDAVAIVGDLNGVTVNFPNGYEPTIKIDDLSLAEKDLVKVVGRLPIAIGLTACGRFAVLKKA